MGKHKAQQIATEFRVIMENVVKRRTIAENISRICPEMSISTGTKCIMHTQHKGPHYGIRHSGISSHSFGRHRA